MDANLNKIVAAITPVVAVFERLDIDYYIGGSAVSSLYGIMRATFDVDLVADLQQRHVKTLVKLLEAEYYIDEDMIRDAIRRNGSFNLLYLDTMFKVDVFVFKPRPFDQEESHRTQQEILVPNTRPFYLASPEGTILNKLEWYRMGGEVSDRQWNDILGVLKVRGKTLDFAYLRKWAVALKVTDLLERAFEDAGLTDI